MELCIDRRPDRNEYLLHVRPLHAWDSYLLAEQLAGGLELAPEPTAVQTDANGGRSWP